MRKRYTPGFLRITEYSITPAGKTLIPVVRQLEQWGSESGPAMKKILGMEDGRIPHAAFCLSRFSTTSFP